MWCSPFTRPTLKLAQTLSSPIRLAVHASCLAEYDLQDQVHAINVAAARLAREVAAAYSTGAKPRFVAGSLGPQTKTISVTGGITFDEVMAAFYTQVLGLLEGGVDLLLIETAQDTLNLKATMLGAQRAMREAGHHRASDDFWHHRGYGHDAGGQSIEALYTSVAHFQPLVYWSQLYHWARSS